MLRILLTTALINILFRNHAIAHMKHTDTHRLVQVNRLPISEHVHILKNNLFTETWREVLELNNLFTKTWREVLELTSEEQMVR